MTQQKRRVTADDVAAAAGVSRAMVSRAFTPGASVSVKKREHVLGVAAALGYRPNLIARGLTGQRTGLVAVVVGSVSKPYEAWLLEHLLAALTERGYQPLLLPAGGNNMSEMIHHALSYQVEGAIVAAGSVSPDIATLCRRSGAPLVLIGRVLDNCQADAVCCDNQAGMAALVNRLLSQGRRRLAWLGGRADAFSHQERLSGAERALASAGHSFVAHAQGDFSLESGVLAATELLRSKTAIDAIVCANDAMALGALEAARRLGIEVPRALAVTGFDDVPSAAFGLCPLTTVTNPVKTTASEALRLLERRMATPAAAVNVVRVAGSLVVRDSA
ncbi:LacI family DNA-binding transcriptional regulator [Halomonas sp. GD1P12]|uniref:LacI family DNA-binding transcriptional regulator n=1 Tax=Halomonas sp. GD1P12 TaxID=2982691 RepID=UPI0021E40A8D|nr:LacI family DNA-binding transcriptional regulator [Halomonas sp. GD1P12]UYF99485.1 LacI family DNA-binding transcriptional regulator [Halomonas sp. GD1P12]